MCEYSSLWLWSEAIGDEKWKKESLTICISLSKQLLAESLLPLM